MSRAVLAHVERLAWLLAILLPLTARGEFKVLFIGNSFTIGSGGGGVPGIFDALAQAGGHENPTTVMRAVGGVDYEFHSLDATTQATIASQPWTHVVLQNYSTEPTHLVDGSHSLADHLLYGASLYRQVITNHPQARVILFETWSRARAHSLITGVSGPNSFASTDEFQAELRTNYHRLANELNAAHPANPPVTVAPIGDAWQNAGGLRAASDPGFVDLHTTDDYHGNNNGYYLAAAVCYSQIFGVSPRGLGTNPIVSGLNLGLTVSSALLEDVAWATVAATNPISFLTQPVSQIVSAGSPATFSAAVQGSPPYFIQWFSNGVAIPSATQLSYTIPAVTPAMDGTLFSVAISNLTSQATSTNAVLQVITDTNPPTLLSATALDGRTLTLVFSEALTPATATNVANYRVNNGAVGVLAAAIGLDGRSVVLTLVAAIFGNFTVVVSGVRDLAGNEILPGAQAGGTVPDPSTRSLLFDFGGANTTVRGSSPDDPLNSWNNVTATIGASDSGQLLNVVAADNTPTDIDLVMIRRFNGANENGTTAAAPVPTDATRDSLFGNTETFSGLANIFPSFKLTGLLPSLSYSFTFYASRMGVGDNRTTGYTVTGANAGFATLNVANNVTNFAIVSGLRPTAAGEITISLAPTAANNNANHFTYLGVLKVQPALVPPRFLTPMVHDGQLILEWQERGQLESAPTPSGPWTAVAPAPTSPFSELVVPGTNRFFRLQATP